MTHLILKITLFTAIGVLLGVIVNELRPRTVPCAEPVPVMWYQV